MQHLHPVPYMQTRSAWRVALNAASGWLSQRMTESWNWLNACVQTGARKRAAPTWTIWGVAGALCCGVTGVLLAAGAACLWVVGAALAHGVTVVAALRVVPETLLALAGALVVCALISAVAFFLLAVALDGVWRATTARQVAS